MDEPNNPFVTSATNVENVEVTQDLLKWDMFLYIGPQWSHYHMITLDQLVFSGLHWLVIIRFQSPVCVCVSPREGKKDREKDK